MRPTKNARKKKQPPKKTSPKIVQKILQCILAQPNLFNKIFKSNNNKIIRPKSDRQKTAKNKPSPTKNPTKMVNINQPFEEQILSKKNADTLFWRLEIKH